MLQPRIIPCLLIKNNGLVKTTNFKDPKYVGDPINAVRIFNEKEVDELVVFDIEATKNQTKPNYQLIKNLAYECRMPLCYGGGVQTVDHFTEIISLGVEKVAICTSAIENDNLVKDAANAVGSQSIVVCLDLKETLVSNRYVLFTHSGKRKTDIDPIEFCKKILQQGAGEIVLNFIDRDGTMKGYQHEFIREVKDIINIPLTVLGGAGSYKDISSLFSAFGVVGAAAGSLFVFKGKYRAVLISYPNHYDKEEIVRQGNLVKQFLH